MDDVSRNRDRVRDRGLGTMARCFVKSRLEPDVLSRAYELVCPSTHVDEVAPIHLCPQFSQAANPIAAWQRGA